MKLSKKFSKQERDNDESEQSFTQRSEGENLNLEHVTASQQQPKQPSTPQETHRHPGGARENVRLTRRQAQQQGRTYNKNTLQFERTSPSEAIKALRKKLGKRLYTEK